MDAITTHEQSDFDGLAAMLAASKLYPRARAILPRRLNRNLRDFLTLYGHGLPFVSRDELAPDPIERLILVDTQAIPSLPGLDRRTEILAFDHHPPDPDADPRITYRGSSAGSTTTLLVRDLIRLGSSASPIEATLLLLGIYEDTGSLAYPGTGPDDYRAAAWLLEQGGQLDVVVDFLRRPLSEDQRKLYQRLLETAEFHEIHGQSIVVATADRAGLVEEISTLAQYLRDLYDPQALFLLVGADGHLQLVARSATDAVDVGEVARHYGGGGHSKAAAALIEEASVPSMRQDLLEYLESRVEAIHTVREIMSHGVHSLEPTNTVAEAEAAMRRYGHEGFPVVRGGELVGVLTRSEIDRAVHHGLLSSPVESFMHKGDISVSPDHSVEHLQEVMMRNGLGQVPVVDSGGIRGIVTRTDLIKLWSAPPQPTDAPKIRDLLAEALPPDLENFLRKAGRVAKQRGYNLYLVGGFVRDLLLGVPNLDVDLVVEGDAIQLAEAMAGAGGGRVHGHPPFGTAKLIWEEDSPVAPLRSLDFVTARTEFYEHPTALPRVERSAIKQDLHRRDFTINTLAISLDEDRYGELLDFYGGEADLARGLIRVLHNLSLVEDPTRILRAVRLEKRLGFRIEERTEELIAGALEFLDRVSGERIRQELEAIFSEDDPTAPLARLQELGVLTRIHPALRLDAERSRWIAALRESWRRWTEMDCRGGTGTPLPSFLFLGILGHGASPVQANGIGVRLGLRVDEREVLRDAEQLQQSSHAVAREDIRPAELRDRLDDYRRGALFLAWATASPQDVLAVRLAQYHAELACVRAELTGDDLKALGIAPGPVFREILKALRDARLDGEVQTRRQERELAVRLSSARDRGPGSDDPP